MYSLRVTTAPTVEPVTLAEAKLHLKIETAETTDDDLITELIKAARQWCESWEGRRYVNTALQLKCDGFDELGYLPYSPVSSVSSVQYIDTDGTTQTLSSTYYTVDTSSEPARIYESYGYSYPTPRDVLANVTVNYVAGYGATAAYTPERVKVAIKILLSEWYEGRKVGEIAENHVVKNILCDRVSW